MMLALIPGLPLAAFVILILVGRRLGRAAAWVSIGALAGAWLHTVRLAAPVLHGRYPTVSWTWLPGGGAWSMGLSVDGLSWIMLMVVTSIGTLIQLYSIGYMHDDARYSRFFAYLSLFCAAMLGVVMADHFVLFFACWELMGLCSYLLISFWFENPEAASAGRKAFLTTRVGDVGLLIGLLLLWTATGELRFERFESLRLNLLLRHDDALLALIGLCIFLGGVGKSAQVPLHVWLPDAMAGPTPVSALIHAATMVAAGVYLIVRAFPLFTEPTLAVVLGVGLTTHLLAGTVALTMTDVKKVLAYSTISQLGLMMTALGLGAPELAIFHLVTHACFKALLFLGAGSVIHATHQQDLSKLGGLWRAMPWTGATFLTAALAMSGIFPLSGFWSKDAILIEARHHAPWAFGWLAAGAVMTSAYIFRLYFRCFHPHTNTIGVGVHGAAPHATPQAHESPPIMVVPLVVLAAAAALVGLVGSPWMDHGFFHALDVTEVHEGIDWSMVGLSLALAAMGIWLAWRVGMRRRNFLPAALRPLGHRLYRVAAHAYFVDPLYERLIVQPFLHATRAWSAFDQQVIDGAVNLAGRAGWLVGEAKAWLDRTVIDGAVNGVAALAQAAGAWSRRLQTGLVQHYLFVIVAAVVILSVWRP